MNKKIILALFASALWTLTPCAFAEEQKKSGPQINIKIDPEIGAILDKFEATIKTLTPAQQEQVQKLLDLNDSVTAIKVEKSLAQGTFAHCSKSKPEILNTHQDEMDSYRHHLDDKIVATQKLAGGAFHQINFVDRKLLATKLNVQSSIMTQMASGLQSIATQSGGLENSCADLLTRLKAPENTPYAQKAIVLKPIKNNLTRDTISGLVTGCFMGSTTQGPDKSYINNVFAMGKDGENYFYDVNTRVEDAKGARLNLADFWIDYDPPNSRFARNHRGNSQEMLISSFTREDVPELLASLKRKGPTASVKAVNWEKHFSYKIQKPDAAVVDATANCVAALDPALKEPLTQKGFTIKPDEQHEKAVSSGVETKDQLYRVSHMSNDPNNPGACVWQVGPYKMENGSELSPVLMLVGFINDQNPMNYKALIWTIGIDQGAKPPQRFSFSDVLITTKDPDTGNVISTKEIKNQTVPGTRHEIHIPMNSSQKLIDGIIKSGLTMRAQPAGMASAITHTFPAPDAASSKAFVNCMNMISKDLTERFKPSGTAKP